MRPLPRKISLPLVALGVAALGVILPVRVHAQIHPAEISATESREVPYRDSGRLTVMQGRSGYLGSASYIRRYTGLTAGHMLYNARTGLSTSVRYQPAFYESATGAVNVSYFGVLSGYQAAARTSDESDAAFEQDMGYLLFLSPDANNKWASWNADPQSLTQGSSFNIIGYAAERLRGDKPARVQLDTPYKLLKAPGLYESTGYYAEQGMSGGPVYATFNGDTRLAAITVGGTSAPSPAYSDVRAITPTEQRLFLEAEYAQGLVKKGFIKGPTTAAPGETVLLKAGIIFTDGTKEKANFSTPYSEAVLTVDVSSKDLVQLTKVGRYKYQAVFARKPPGLPVFFNLLRTTTGSSNQTPLATFKVMMQ